MGTQVQFIRYIPRYIHHQNQQRWFSLPSNVKDFEGKGFWAAPTHRLGSRSGFSNTLLDRPCGEGRSGTSICNWQPCPG